MIFKKRFGKAKPWEQGVLQRLIDLFIAPMNKYRPDGTGPKEWLEDVFSTDTREVHRYKVKREFKHKGRYRLVPALPMYGLNTKSKVPKGSLVFIRIDSTMPDRVEMEVFKEQGGKDMVFVLTPEEYKRDVLPNIEFLPPRRKRGPIKKGK